MSSIPASAVGHGSGHGSAANHSTPYSNGVLGVIFFLCSEVALFGSLIFAYLYLRHSVGVWPPKGIERHPLEVALGAANLVILLSSSVWCYFAERAIAHGKQALFLFWLAVTIVCGATFVTIQGIEYHNLRGVAINNDLFGATFFTLTGLHGFHVSLGVVAWIVLFLYGTRGHWTASHHFPVRLVSYYWHFVDVVWVILFSLFYLWQ